ncbi:MAG: hypothetical protein GX561_10425 [Lentisphaerae bacterium]|nr:hypothetical protein [Lentisphaerota bacterium]
MLNAIFCRTCGEKLDLNELKPENLTQAAKAASAKELASKRANQIVGIILTVILVVILAGALIPPAGKLAVAEPSAEALAKFEDALGKKSQPAASSEGKGKKKKRAEKAAAAKDVEATFTDEEASSLANKSMKLPQAEGGGNMIPTGVTVRFLESGNVKVILSCKAYGFLPLNYVVEWKPTLSGKGNLLLEDLKPQLGWLPMPIEQLSKFVTDQFNAMSGSCGELNTIRRRLKKASVSAGQLTITTGD